MTAYPAAPRAYFERDARHLARALVGAHLVRTARAAPGARGGRVAQVARIVETEAYRGPTDGACHARVGLTSRTKTLLGPPGFAYVFLIYGMYDCFNVVCLGEGEGHAVLVRAAEPVLGFAPGARCDGPGKLTRAMGITRADDGCDLTGPPLYVSPRPDGRAGRVKVALSARVGVAYAGAIAERRWRFFDAASGHVSRPPARAIGLGRRVGPGETG